MKDNLNPIQESGRLRFIEKGKDIAIANKETIVSGGKLIIDKSKLSGSKIIPIDSEHNALFQLMKKK